MIKLIAIDLDGTLLNSKKEITKENMEALHYARQKGVKIVICTGRPYLGMKHLVEEIGLNSDDDYVIIFNGAQVRRASNGEVLISSKLTQSDMERWYAESNRLDLPFNPIDDEWVYEPLAYPEGYESLYVGHISQAPAKTVDFSYFSSEHTFNKFVVTVDEAHLSKQLTKIDMTLMTEYSIALSHPFQLEIMASGTNKGEAVRQFAEKLNIPMDEVVTIGDQENDRSMLELPVHSVAMGNASDSLKELAEYVTDTNDNSGVAQAIYHYVK